MPSPTFSLGRGPNASRVNGRPGSEAGNPTSFRKPKSKDAKENLTGGQPQLSPSVVDSRTPPRAPLKTLPRNDTTNTSRFTPPRTTPITVPTAPRKARVSSRPSSVVSQPAHSRKSSTSITRTSISPPDPCRARSPTSPPSPPSPSSLRAVAFGRSIPRPARSKTLGNAQIREHGTRRVSCAPMDITRGSRSRTGNGIVAGATRSATLPIIPKPAAAVSGSKTSFTHGNLKTGTRGNTLASAEKRSPNAHGLAVTDKKVESRSFVRVSGVKVTRDGETGTNRNTSNARSLPSITNKGVSVDTKSSLRSLVRVAKTPVIEPPSTLEADLVEQACPIEYPPGIVVFTEPEIESAHVDEEEIVASFNRMFANPAKEESDDDDIDDYAHLLEEDSPPVLALRGPVGKIRQIEEPSTIPEEGECCTGFWPGESNVPIAVEEPDLHEDMQVLLRLFRNNVHDEPDYDWDGPSAVYIESSVPAGGSSIKASSSELATYRLTSSPEDLAMFQFVRDGVVKDLGHFEAPDWTVEEATMKNTGVILAHPSSPHYRTPERIQVEIPALASVPAPAAHGFSSRISAFFKSWKNKDSSPQTVSSPVSSDESSSSHDKSCSTATFSSSDAASVLAVQDIESPYAKGSRITCVKRWFASRA